MDTGYYITANGYIAGPQGYTRFYVAANGVVIGPGGQTAWRFIGDQLTENGIQTYFRRQSGRIITQLSGQLPSFLR